MPRRKQQAPRRSVAYGDEEEFKADEKIDEEHLQDDGLSLDGQDGEYLCNDDDDAGERFSFQNSPLSNGTNPDAGYASPLSDTSDQLIDFQSPNPNPSKDGRDKEVEEAVREEADLPEVPNNLSLQDSLAQMKAVYANLISDASWSSITMDMLRSSSNSNKVSHVTSNGSNHKGSNGIPNGHANSVVNNNSHTNSSSNSGTSAATNSSTNTTATSTANATNNGNGISTGTTGGVAYDWHQAALAKTLQHTPYHLLPEPSLFSTVQLYRQNNKLYGPVFTGASKFRCKDCSGAYDTLVGLTVHMNESGHYRDDNKDKDEERGKRWAKPRKRSLMEMEGKEDAQKVLKCMYCGHSFESLQDLSVHMIKTKHYQKVPLKEPMPTLTSKLVPPTKKRSFQDLVPPCSPESVHNTPVTLGDTSKDQKVVNPYVTANNRYGYQNGASYTWQFEARKAQILKCMECGSSHDTLQQLTAHMMVTGHFLKVTNSASKKGKQLVFDHVVEEKVQSIPLPPTSTRLPAANEKTRPASSPLHSIPVEEQRDEHEEEKTDMSQPGKKIKEEKVDPTEKSEKAGKAGHCKYLTEEDLEESPKGGLDILKSLENTVSSAISKAQTGTPTWGGAGYPSIHAAYQLQGSLKQSVQVVQPLFSTSSLKGMSSESTNLIHSPSSTSPPLSHKSNVLAMEELVEKVTGNVSVKKEKEEKMENKCKVRSAKSPSPLSKERKGSPKPDSLNKPVKNISVVEQTESRCREGEANESKMDPLAKKRTEVPKKVSNGGNSLGIITDHWPEQPFVNPLSALQSIMNNHLGKASKTVTPFLDPLAMLYKISNNMMEKPINSTTQVKQVESISKFYENNDQPMDLTKSKNTNERTANSISSNGRTVNSTSTTMNNTSNCNNNNNSNRPILSSLSESLSSPLRENALMDISDMVKNLTGRLTPKSSTPSSISEKSDADNSGFEDALEELSTVQKRKGRQSNWNPQHLLILQAQFTSCLREMADGKFVITDLGPQERVHICKFTGLSMTTISHWLANVKYQLRRTGGTKFLKNIDSGQPLFLCSDCSSQFRTPSSYISHLESHLGFSMKDLSKLSVDLLREQKAVTRMITDKTFSSLGLTDEDSGSVFQCKLCNRTFVSKHAVKLHLSKTHGKSPDDHLIFVTELEKFDKA